jgi:protein-tyrosine phosphatase
MVAMLEAIDDHLRQGRLVYLHCWGGIGRTGTVVGCWLSRQGVQGTATLDRLRQLWQACLKSAHRTSPETHEQEQYIVHWEENQ